MKYKPLLFPLGSNTNINSELPLKSLEDFLAKFGLGDLVYSNRLLRIGEGLLSLLQLCGNLCGVGDLLLCDRSIKFSGVGDLLLIT